MLPNSYTVKYGSLGDYFEAIKQAEPPERFSQKFLYNLEFKSTNDRQIIGILKELGFIDGNGAPTERYFQFLDSTISEKILAEGIKEMYSDLFNVNKNAYELTSDEAYSKLRTLYSGSKKDSLIKLIAKTFSGLCEIADFSGKIGISEDNEKKINSSKTEKKTTNESPKADISTTPKNVNLGSLQYHINIVLPESRDQGVYDAIFKSLKDHLN